MVNRDEFVELSKTMVIENIEALRALASYDTEDRCDDFALTEPTAEGAGECDTMTDVCGEE